MPRRLQLWHCQLSRAITSWRSRKYRLEYPRLVRVPRSLSGFHGISWPFLASGYRAYIKKEDLIYRQELLTGIYR